MKVACIILAAGRSQRFGEADKLLAKVNGKLLIRSSAECALKSQCTVVQIVTRPDADQLLEALSGLRVVIRPNPQFAEGIGSSIACGISGLAPNIAGALILPADMPWMQSSLLNTLIEHFRAKGGKSIVYPTTPQGEQRNPVLWPQSEFSNLIKLNGDQGARRLIAATTAEKVEITVQRDEVFRDVDTPTDVPR